MKELRKDYLLDRYVIIAPDRKNRPENFRQPEENKQVDKCPFCPGNESMAPPEIGRIEDENGWYIRWFENKFAFVSQEGDPTLRTDNTYFTWASGYGRHEVIVETPKHNDEMHMLSEKHIAEILKVYRDRIGLLSRLDGIKYVNVFRNQGIKGGTSLVHSHSQVVAHTLVPKVVREKLEATSKLTYCPYCDIIAIEKGSFRRCYENESFVAFAPYASRFPFEIWVFPKRHVSRMDELKDNEFADWAQILKKILIKLKEMNASFNYFIHYAPKGEDLHLHMEVVPRITLWAGFEYSSDVCINIVPPEDAAEFYRS